MKRGPASKRPSSDDGHMRFQFHKNKFYIPAVEDTRSDCAGEDASRGSRGPQVITS
jgi:hypothetical protein